MKRAVRYAVLLFACSRRAEIEDAPDPGEVTVLQPPRPDGELPTVVDAPLANAAGLACAERPDNAECRGPNDFPCDFDAWFQNLAEACQRLTNCTDGWVQAQLGSDGCATELRMEDPDPGYVACISEQLSRYHCPCRDVVSSRFLGLDHGECAPLACGTGELRCPPGLACVASECVLPARAEGGCAGR